jgi:hypothetical protein
MTTRAHIILAGDGGSSQSWGSGLVIDRQGRRRAGHVQRTCHMVSEETEGSVVAAQGAGHLSTRVRESISKAGAMPFIT